MVAVSADSYPVRWAGRLAVVAIPGEIDLSNATAMLTKLLSVLDRQPATLIVDMTATTFCDSTGINAVLQAHKHARRLDVKLRLVATAPAARRVFALAGLDDVIDIYPSLAASLAGQPPGRPGGSAADDPDALDPPAHAGGPAGPGGR